MNHYAKPRDTIKEEIGCGEHENQRRQCNSPLRARSCSMKHPWRRCNGDAKKGSQRGADNEMAVCLFVCVVGDE
jgi:hypothetical protein